MGLSANDNTAHQQYLNSLLIFAEVAPWYIWSERWSEGLAVVGAHVDLLVVLPTDRDRLPMVVDLPPVVALRPTRIDPGVKEHFHPRNRLSKDQPTNLTTKNLGEDQPDIDHLNVSRLGKAS